MVDTARKGSKTGSVRVSLEVHGHREIRAAVVGVIKDRNLGATGGLSCNLYRVFDSLCTRVKKRGLFLFSAWSVAGE